MRTDYESLKEAGWAILTHEYQETPLSVSGRGFLSEVAIRETADLRDGHGTLMVSDRTTGEVVGFVAWSQDPDVVGLDPRFALVEAIAPGYAEEWEHSPVRAAALVVAANLGEADVLLVPDVAFNRLALSRSKFDCDGLLTDLNRMYGAFDRPGEEGSDAEAEGPA